MVVAIKSPVAGENTKRKPGAPKAEDRIPVILTAARTDIPMPVNVVTRRGAKSPLATELEGLAVGASVGVSNKTQSQISSTLSKINGAKSNNVQDVDSEGKPVFENGSPITDASGAVIGHNQVPKMRRLKEYKLYVVDPKTDPDKVSLRIFRMK